MIDFSRPVMNRALVTIPLQETISREFPQLSSMRWARSDAREEIVNEHGQTIDQALKSVEQRKEEARAMAIFP
jgi:hypothetical protein